MFFIWRLERGVEKLQQNKGDTMTKQSQIVEEVNMEMHKCIMRCREGDVSKKIERLQCMQGYGTRGNQLHMIACSIPTSRHLE